MKLRVAAVNWKLRRVRSDGEFFAHLYDLVNAAYDQKCDLVVLPELFCLELLGLEPDLEERKVPAFLNQFADELENWFLRISESSGLTIVGGSFFKETDDGMMNLSETVAPDRSVVRVFKNKLTTYERLMWRLHGGSGLRQAQNPKLGSLICYDSEFPEAARALAEAGVEAIAVPAFTETPHGFQRVRSCCLARAVENQVFVIHSSLVGSLGREPVPSAFGTAAVLAPSIEPFPASGILAETDCDEEGLAVAELDFEALHNARRSGDVRNWQDRAPSLWTVTEA